MQTKFPNNPKLQYMRAVALHYLGDATGALRDLHNCLIEDPDDNKATNLFNMITNLEDVKSKGVNFFKVFGTSIQFIHSFIVVYRCFFVSLFVCFFLCFFVFFFFGSFFISKIGCKLIN